MSQQVRLGDLLGNELESDFAEFDLTEIKAVEESLKGAEAIDLAHAELMQQQALRGADILIEYMAKMVKTIGYLETKVNSVRNKVSLEYQAPDGARTTTDMKIWAGNASKEVEEIQIRLASAKGSKVYLEKKYDVLIRSHHHFKEIAQGLRKTILGFAGPANTSTPSGWD